VTTASAAAHWAALALGVGEAMSSLIEHEPGDWALFAVAD
jgi:hypothetical protein